ncbi:MAG: hypothetical protein IKR68_08870 [Lachnospiraceae bacterium]|nr:hypothetical protein [Lachnospiraceae bacterium]
MESTERSEENISPYLEEFLDAESVKQRLDVLRRIREHLDDKMIDTMAIALDVVIPEGDLDTRIYDLMSCLETKLKYEIERR